MSTEFAYVGIKDGTIRAIVVDDRDSADLVSEWIKMGRTIERMLIDVAIARMKKETRARSGSVQLRNGAAMIERAFYSIREFCERNAISRATFYRRVPQDQLVKVGRKTLVPIACEQAWHAKLQEKTPCLSTNRSSTTSEI